MDKTWSLLKLRIYSFLVFNIPLLEEGDKFREIGISLNTCVVNDRPDLLIMKSSKSVMILKPSGGHEIPKGKG